MIPTAPHLHPTAFSDDEGVATLQSSWIVQIFSVSSASAQTRIARLLSIATDLHVEEVSNGRRFYVVTECADHSRADAIWAFVAVIDPGAQLEHQVNGVGSLEVVAERLATTLPRELL
ncbi:MAG TPA: hypothetical protein VM093_04855 [Aeromicrobium sp.]|nr:hypothetical protein [Aeromicrobium sp.]